MLGLSACPASATITTLVCTDPIRHYSILFDDKSGILIWKSALAQVQYQLHRVDQDNGRVMIRGRTSHYGNDYLLVIAEKSWIQYFYGNGSNDMAPCTIISRKN